MVLRVNTSTSVDIIKALALLEINQRTLYLFLAKRMFRNYFKKDEVCLTDCQYPWMTRAENQFLQKLLLIVDFPGNYTSTSISAVGRLTPLRCYLVQCVTDSLAVSQSVLCMRMYICVCVSVCLAVCLSVRLCVSSVYPSVCMSVCLSVCLFVPS